MKAPVQSENSVQRDIVEPSKVEVRNSANYLRAAPMRPSEKLVSAELVRELFDYNPDTGVFKWRHRGENITGKGRGTTTWNAKYPGKETGYLHKGHGYVTLTILGRSYLAHRVAWLYVTGKWPSEEIDHVDCARTNNRFGNLREATHSQNQANSPPYKSNLLGVKGVYKKGNVFRASIKTGGKTIHLGSYPDIRQAMAAYEAAAAHYHGAFARHNYDDSEDALQTCIVEYLRLQLPSCLVFAVPNGGFRTQRQAAILKKTGVLAGIPDLFIMAPLGMSYAIEIKRKNGRLSEAQARIRDHMIKHGMPYAVCRSIDDARAAIAHWGLPTREAA